MTKVWWVLAIAGAAACSSAPDAGGGAAGDGGSASDSRVGEAGAAETATGVRPECAAWAACDSCASACDSDDGACVNACADELLAPGGLFQTARLAPCDRPFLDCYATLLGGLDGPGNCAALRPCCEKFAAQDGDAFCNGIAGGGVEARCLLLRAGYTSDGGSCELPTQ